MCAIVTASVENLNFSPHIEAPVYHVHIRLLFLSFQTGAPKLFTVRYLSRRKAGYTAARDYLLSVNTVTAVLAVSQHVARDHEDNGLGAGFALFHREMTAVTVNNVDTPAVLDIGDRDLVVTDGNGRRK